MAPPLKQFEHLKIQLEAIISATNNFADENCIGRGGFGKVYKGEIDNTMVALKCLDREYGQGDPEFWKEIMMLSVYKHENIVSLLGYCDDYGEKILIYEYLPRKSLDRYLKSSELTWVRRLKICIGAARGLAFLHNPEGTQQRVLHRDIKSSNILLDENWNAKISDFGLSKFGPANKKNTFLISHPVGTHGYCDPLYAESAETGFLSKESDIYSFGVVLCEVLCGRLCMVDDKLQPLVGLTRQSFRQNMVNQIVLTNIRDEINQNSLDVFSKVAYQCLKLERDEHPLITEIVRGLEAALQYQVSEPSTSFSFSLPSPLDSSSYTSIKRSQPCRRFQFYEIQLATKNFDETLIVGRGGFGNVYKGNVFDGSSLAVAAIKRLDSSSYQGATEFWPEVEMLSTFRHCNIVSLIGYCNHENEMILVYEYIPNGTLYDHLHELGTPLSWLQRLHICIDAGRGLHYLHTGVEVGVIHRDIKTSNVLLDESWTAKIADLGLAKIVPRNQTSVEADVKGTFGYLDHDYFFTRKLTRKSDMYAFGVVLDSDIRDQIAPQCLKEFVRTAEACLRNVTIEYCVDRLRNDTEKQKEFLAQVTELKTKLDAELRTKKKKPNNEEIYQNLLGVNTPKQVIVKAPEGIRNKCCGTGGGRFIGPGEKAKTKAKTKKKGRTYSICDETGHNMHTCENRKSKDQGVSNDDSGFEEEWYDNESSDNAN